MNENSFILSSESDKRWCLENNVRITNPGAWDYPQAFMGIPYRPGILFYIGHPVWLEHNLISVVGSRAPQAQSLKWLEDNLSALLRNRHLGVVSGGARGVDQKAHQLALRTERPTVVFLPSGLRHIYPFDFIDWVKPIVDQGGCIISPFLPSQPMHKRFFRERNRWIAALSPFTLIVECGRRSGTMLTANFALEYERTLGVMPTFPGEVGMGGLDLICDGVATPIRDHVDMELIVDGFSKLIITKD